MNNSIENDGITAGTSLAEYFANVVRIVEEHGIAAREIDLVDRDEIAWGWNDDVSKDQIASSIVDRVMEGRGLA